MPLSSSQSEPRFKTPDSDMALKTSWREVEAMEVQGPEGGKKEKKNHSFVYCFFGGGTKDILPRYYRKVGSEEMHGCMSLIFDSGGVAWFLKERS